MINNTLSCACPQPGRSPRLRHRIRVHHHHHGTISPITPLSTTSSSGTTSGTTSTTGGTTGGTTTAITIVVPTTNSQGASKMAGVAPNRVIQELPQQNFDSIQRSILAKRRHGVLPSEEAFVDPRFPPDQTSLTYVYSGDDKYERMVYRRPQELCPHPLLVGPPCGALLRHPVRRWAGRQWLLHVLATVSLNPSYMERLIPGTRNREQSFGNNYTGAFQFELWRFGEWVTVVVDDNLPVLDGRLAFCPALGSPPQFWTTLLEKAYAKCNKAYEAIEVGNPLSALTDFTGAICEHFSPQQEVAPSGGYLFYLLYRSSVSRSLIVAWRSVHSFRESTIRPGSTGASNIYNFGAAWSQENPSSLMMLGPNLFLITAVTKFPLRDGRMLEMVRLKCPHDAGVTWWGDFSLQNDLSWHRVNPTFMENYRPRHCLDPSEFWIPFIEFCRHFANLVICSSTQPYKGFDCNDCSPWQGEDDYNLTMEGFGSEYIDPVMGKPPPGAPEGAQSFQRSPLHQYYHQEGGGGSIGITVQENPDTVKVDTTIDQEEGSTLFVRRAGGGRMQQQQQQGGRKDSVTTITSTRSRHSSGDSMTVTAVSRRPSMCNKADRRGSNSTRGSSSDTSGTTNTSSHVGKVGSSTTTTTATTTTTTTHTTYSSVRRDESVTSNLSSLSNFSNTSLSDSESTNSASEVKIRLKSSSSSHRHYADRPCSAPAKSPNHSRGTRKSLSMFDARTDYFRSQGSWRTVVRYFGRWEKATSGGPPCDMDAHSRNPRITFALSNPDAVNEIIPAEYHGKCHILVSLLQDYRRGAKTANGLLVNVGFRLYKSKAPEKDEKRHLSKLQVIRDVTSANESREITARLDLDPGFYVLVPYTYHVGQEGGFLVRILAEKDQLAGKTGCTVS